MFSLAQIPRCQNMEGDQKACKCMSKRRSMRCGCPCAAVSHDQAVGVRGVLDTEEN